jgi:hypothetical protein
VTATHDPEGNSLAYDPERDEPWPEPYQIPPEPVGDDSVWLADRHATEEPARPPLSFVRGGAWLLDTPPGIPAVWGRDDEVLWADGETLLVVGPAGVGKTTLAGQLLYGRLGLLDDNKVLGYPITPGERVLYLAMDRPRQISRAFARLARPEHRAMLDDRLVTWQGPPPRDLAKYPEVLAYMANEAKADTVFIDSLKDAALGLSDDEVGAGLNRAFQMALAEGKQVIGLHHQRKQGSDGVKPKQLDAVYGSTWITAGAGSVVLLWGHPGDSVVELTHLKQPGAPVGPLQIEHDHTTGLSSVHRGFDVLVFLRGRPNGVTAAEVAKARYGKETPSPNQERTARRQLDRLVPDYARKDDAIAGGATGTQPARWYAVDNRHGEAA